MEMLASIMANAGIMPNYFVIQRIKNASNFIFFIE